MKTLKAILIIFLILLILASCHLVGYMIRVMITINPEVDIKVIVFFGIGIIGIAAGVTVLLLLKRL